MTKTPKHKLYPVAREMFVEQGMTCSAIAETLGIAESTLSVWRQKQEWDNARAEALAAPDTIRAILLKELQSISEGNKPRIDTDALSKVAKTLTYFDGKVSLSVVIAVLRELDEWMAGIDAKTAIDMTEYHKAFINHRAKLEALK